jgi:hypothetical protein
MRRLRYGVHAVASDPLCVVSKLLSTSLLVRSVLRLDKNDLSGSLPANIESLQDIVYAGWPFCARV